MNDLLKWLVESLVVCTPPEDRGHSSFSHWVSQTVKLVGARQFFSAMKQEDTLPRSAIGDGVRGSTAHCCTQRCGRSKVCGGKRLREWPITPGLVSATAITTRRSQSSEDARYSGRSSGPPVLEGVQPRVSYALGKQPWAICDHFPAATAPLCRMPRPRQH